MSQPIHITLAQINPVVGDIEFNLKTIRRVRDAAPDRTDLIVFPELCVCGYPPEDLVLKPSFMDRVEDAVRALAQESKGSGKHLIVGAPWRENGKTYNAAHLIGGGKILATRYKHHLPNYGVFDEARVFSPGPLPAPVEFRDLAIGLMVCEDMWHEDVAAHLKREGAELLIVPNGSPFETDKRETRRQHAQARVKQTGLPLIYVNQCGGQDELVFDGASFVLGESGRLVIQAKEFVEDIHHTLWERAPGGHWFLGAENVSPAPGETASVYNALVIGLRDYVAKNGFPGVLIGLSGGIDSAVTAAIAADALGPQAVQCVMMPSRFTSRESLDDAAAGAKALGVNLDTIPIMETVEAFEETLATHFTSGTPGVAHENIQSRCRGLILMALSNSAGRMVLSTGNKSEMAVGYATLYGDMCGGFNVLKDVYKTQVYELARWRNANRPEHGFGPAGTVIPERVLTKAPTAELRPNQTDQDTLPPYDALDDILHCLIELDLAVEAIAARGHDRSIVEKVWRMLDAAEYKRRQAPPGIKITSRAFGRDRRYPMTNRFRAQG